MKGFATAECTCGDSPNESDVWGEQPRTDGQITYVVWECPCGKEHDLKISPHLAEAISMEAEL